jgi:hypothetical protein
MRRFILFTVAQLISMISVTSRRARHRGLLGLVIVVAGLLPSVTTDAQGLSRATRLTEDNDYFNFWLPPRVRSDDNYTQGARLTWDFASVPRFAHKLLCRSEAACGATVEVGQEIYTPTVDSEWPIIGERPYAGWLYGRGEVRAGKPRTMRSVDIIVGLTGPPSLAEAVQNGFHHLIPGFRQPLGWANQLPTEIGFGIRAA